MQGHLVDETKDHDVVWIHRHPNNSVASKADREAAFEAGVQAIDRVNVTVNNATQEAELVMQVEVQDHYAWYKNEEVGESSVIEVSFNLKDLEAGRDEPLFDWPADG